MLLGSCCASHCQSARGTGTVQNTPTITTIPCGELGQELCWLLQPGGHCRCHQLPGLSAQNQELSLVSQSLAVPLAGVLR